MCTPSMVSIGESLSSIRVSYDALQSLDLKVPPDDMEISTPDFNRSKEYLVEKYLTPRTNFSKEWLNELQKYV
jgi:hypothetical protein